MCILMLQVMTTLTSGWNNYLILFIDLKERPRTSAVGNKKFSSPVAASSAMTASASMPTEDEQQLGTAVPVGMDGNTLVYKASSKH